MRRTILLSTALALSLTSCAGSDPGPAADPGTPATAAGDTASTEPGTDLGYGEVATLVWQPAANLTGALDLSVDAVAEQPQSVFDGWVRDEAMADARPYFVTVSLTNSGDTDLADQAVPLYLRDDHGALGAPWTLGGDFTACQSGPLPAPFEPDAEAEMCLVYLVPDGGRIKDMVFEPTEGFDPISWTGEVAEPDNEPDKSPGTRPGKKKPGGG